jgi:hypothetical protein
MSGDVTEPPGQTADDRAVCIALAGWLRAHAVLAQLSLLLALVAALVLLCGRASAQGTVLLIGVLILAPAERYLAIRLAFDRELFDAWGRGAMDASAIDTALLRLGLRKDLLAARPFADRMAGALRLRRLHLIAVLAQTVLIAASLWIVLR